MALWKSLKYLSVTHMNYTYIYIKSQIVLLYNFAHFSPLKNIPSIYWPKNVKLGERPYNVICQIFSMALPLQGTVLLLASSNRIQH